MSVQVLSDTRRPTRKPHRCGMCTAVIPVGALHRVASCVYDGRLYDWRDCLPCDDTGVLNYADNYAGGPDEGVSVDTADEWAGDAVRWRSHWNRPTCALEQAAARLAGPRLRR